MKMSLYKFNFLTLNGIKKIPKSDGDYLRCFLYELFICKFAFVEDGKGMDILNNQHDILSEEDISLLE